MKRVIILTGFLMLAFAGTAAAATWNVKFGQQEKKTVQYQCPMHPQVVSDKPGDCPICHMRLVPIESAAEPKEICLIHDCPMVKGGQPCPMLVIAEKGEKLECPVCKTKIGIRDEMSAGTLPSGYASVLISPQKQQLIGIQTKVVELKKTTITVPAQAVFFTGTSNIVFVDHGNNLFEPREVTLGARVRDFYEVKRGLKAGESVVVNGNFLVQSESRLKAALTNFGGSAGHQHGA